MKESLIIKYISGEASEEEKISVLQWIASDPANRKRFLEMKNIYVHVNASLLGDLATGGGGERIEAKFVEEDPDLRRLLSRANARSRRWRFIYISAVAAAVVSFGIFSFVRISRAEKELDFVRTQSELAYIEYRTNNGVKSTVTLPDGSKVILNSGSSIRVPNVFTGEFREVAFKGEALFDVVKNPEFPMKITLNKDTYILVRGTKFNLSSYSGDSEIQAYLMSGNISLMKKNEYDDRFVEYRIEPNDKIFVPAEKASDADVKIIRPEDSLPTIGWKDGWMIFDETLLSDVITRLERWYGVSVEVQDKQLLSKRFTARFKDESITQVLDIMKQIKMLDFELDENRVILKTFR